MDVPVEKLILRHPLKNFDLTDPEKYIPVTLIYDFMAQVDRYIGPPGLVSSLSGGFEIQDLGDYGHQILSNPNFLDFLQEAIKYESVICTNLHMNLQVMGDRARFSFVFTDPPAPGREFAVAINISQTFDMFRIFGGPDWTPLELQVPGRSIKTIEPILLPGNYPIRYGFPDFGIIFPTEMLGRKNPFRSENNGLPGLMIPEEKLSQRIEQLLQSYKPGQMSSIVDFSGYFNLSVRSIRRILMAEGITFSEIRERTIFLKAVGLLTSTKWTVNEITDCLGYNETANFIRFFKRYIGISPGKYREASYLASNDNLQIMLVS